MSDILIIIKLLVRKLSILENEFQESVDLSCAVLMTVLKSPPIMIVDVEKSCRNVGSSVFWP